MKTNEIIVRALAAEDEEIYGSRAMALSQAVLTALSEAGLVVVPREPTPEMFEAAGAPVDGNTQAISAFYEDWKDVITAAEKDNGG